MCGALAGGTSPARGTRLEMTLDSRALRVGLKTVNVLRQLCFYLATIRHYMYSLQIR